METGLVKLPVNYTIIVCTDVAPTPTEAICRHFNELRSDLALALDLKNALSSCEFELQALRHQYEALNPGKVMFIFV